MHFLFALSLSLACSESESKKSTDSSKGRTITLESELTFVDKDGIDIRTLQIAIADEQMERNQGLMDVREMGSDEGMLFIFDENQPLNFLDGKYAIISWILYMLGPIHQSLEYTKILPHFQKPLYLLILQQSLLLRLMRVMLWNMAF